VQHGVQSSYRPLLLSNRAHILKIQPEFVFYVSTKMLSKNVLLLLVPFAVATNSATILKTPDQSLDSTLEDPSAIDISSPVSELSVTPHQKLQKRLGIETYCNGGNGDDGYSGVMGQIASRLQNNQPEQLEYVGSRSAIAWRYGYVQVCVNNNYAFDNMHVKRWEVGWAVQQIYQNCCAGKDRCRLGGVVAHGDTGKNLPVHLTKGYEQCDRPTLKDL
jgi:hypothetical protein